MSTAAHVTHAERLANARRVVVKIGSALFVDQQTGALDRAWLEGVCADVAELRRAGKEVVIVSSGAVALGRGELKLVAPLAARGEPGRGRRGPDLARPRLSGNLARLRDHDGAGAAHARRQRDAANAI